MDNKIIAIVGQLGSGKTLAMTHMASYNYAVMAKTIYSNYHLKRIPYVPITSLEQIELMKDGVFVADEFWSWVDSRTTKTKRNR